ncbi:MAG: hypothetical protein ACKPJD_18620, partial [Planctomycetaceae bacterium]
MPVLFLAVVWLAMSLGTNFYLRWVETRYDELFSRNLASMQAASLLSHLVGECAENWYASHLTGVELQEYWRDRLGERQRLQSLLQGA